MIGELQRQDALIRESITRGSSVEVVSESKYGEGALKLFQDEGAMFIYRMKLCSLLQNFH